MKERTDEVLRWVVIRAFRWGEVRRADLQRAFPDIGNTQASQQLSLSVALKPELLRREGRKIVKRPGAKPPHYVGDTQLARDLVERGNDFKALGIDIEVRHRPSHPCTPIQPGALMLIAKRMSQQLCVDIHYVGLKVRDEGSIRTVYPQQFEVHGEDIYLMANDLSSPGKLLKSFHVSRIVSAEKSDRRRPSHLPGLMDNDAEVRFQAKLNPAASEPQKQVIRHQLNLNGTDQVSISPRFIPDFKKRSCAPEAQTTFIWPLLTDLKEI
ncbi:WYL domain-containing protein [Photobacterium lutimaris]|uniref:WYL domain-containing protein n=1 Tax=Photobacterium lutimaris TaxID=388278 RepID=A0A2T3J4Q2_9GAMM|nr:WYL domain-containing protein [Photobacterium lutimaris]PSU36282.1 hypothetical protein C9I99_04595 [Photobacterium lutimaris]TDR74834.1 WYL domain-containing protein [Photobacterium lutimaris]